MISLTSGWDTRWRNAIIELPVGHPIPYIFYPVSSGNLILPAYHVAQFEEKTGYQIHDVELEIEKSHLVREKRKLS